MKKQILFSILLIWMFIAMLVLLSEFVVAGEFDACNSTNAPNQPVAVVDSDMGCVNEGGNYSFDWYLGALYYDWERIDGDDIYYLWVNEDNGWKGRIFYYNYSGGDDMIFGDSPVFIEEMSCNSNTGVLNGIFEIDGQNCIGSGGPDCSGKNATVILGSFSPRVNVWLKPDFFEKYANGSQVNYTNIFPPVLNCTAYVKDPDGEDTDEITLNFTFSAESTIYENRTLYSTEISCQNKHNCSIILPEQNAKRIYPQDKVICNVTPTDNENNIGASNSSNITMPSFDLFITKIATINVIEDVSLVANKSLMVRVWAFFDSNLITYMDKDVYVKLNSSLGDNTWTSFKPMKNFSLETIKNNVKAKPENPDAKDMEILNKVKRGEDSANFFRIKLPPSAGSVTYGATVDSADAWFTTYNESNESNNYFSKNFDVVETKKIKILVIAVNVSELIRTDPWWKSLMRSTKIGKSYYPGKDEEIFLSFYSQFTFFKKVYPCLIENTILKSEMNFQTSILDGVAIDDLSVGQAKYIRAEVLKELQKIADKERADVVVGFVHKSFLLTKSDASGDAYAHGIAMYNERWYGNTGYKNVILLGVDVPSYVMAHEIGHLNGLGESYSGDGSNLGSLSHDGWLLDQEFGFDMMPIVNVWTEPNSQGKYDNRNDVLNNPTFFPKTKVNLPSGELNLFFDIMAGGSDSITGDVVHMKKTDYEELLKRYKK